MRCAGKIYVMLIMMGMLILGSQTFAQETTGTPNTLDPQEKAIISISSRAAKGDLVKLRQELIIGLESGLTINQIKEVLVHLYAYCGFPRSIRAIQTFMDVLNDRKEKGIQDTIGAEASPVTDTTSKYVRGKNVLGELSGVPQDGPLTGYNAFAPAIDTFLKEHLFADIFERDVLTYQQRELTTIAVLATIGDTEPMLRAHYGLCLNVGITPEELKDFIVTIKPKAGPKKSGAAETVLNDVLKNRQEK